MRPAKHPRLALRLARPQPLQHLLLPMPPLLPQHAPWTTLLLAPSWTTLLPPLLPQHAPWATLAPSKVPSKEYGNQARRKATVSPSAAKGGVENQRISERGFLD